MDTDTNTNTKVAVMDRVMVETSSTPAAAAMVTSASTTTTVTSKPSYLPSPSWQGMRSGYYFGTSTQGTGYYLDEKATTGNTTGNTATTTTTTSSNAKKRRRITIDEDMNTIRTIHNTTKTTTTTKTMSAEELLQQAEEAQQQEQAQQGDGQHAVVVLDVTTKRGRAYAKHQLEKAYRTNAMQRAQYQEGQLASSTSTLAFSKLDPTMYMESELQLHQTMMAWIGLGATPEIVAEMYASKKTNDDDDDDDQTTEENDMTLFTHLLSHDNTDIAITMIRIFREWLDQPDTNETGSSNTDTVTATAIHMLATTMLEQNVISYMIANLGRFTTTNNSTNTTTNNDNDDGQMMDEQEQQGMDDILFIVELLLERQHQEPPIVVPIPQQKQQTSQSQQDYYSVAEYLIHETSLLGWLIEQIPNQTNNGRSMEILALLAQQSELYSNTNTTNSTTIDWTQIPIYQSILMEDDDEVHDKKKSTKTPNSKTLDAMELLLQAMATFRKTQPKNPTQLEYLENVVLTLASILTYSLTNDKDSDSVNTNETGNSSSTSTTAMTKNAVDAFLDKQGPALVVRCLSEKVHAGGIGLTLLDLPHARACHEMVVHANLLKYLFPIFMGRNIPKPASSSSVVGNTNGTEETITATKKSKRLWWNKLQESTIHIIYHLTRFLTGEAQERLLVKFLQVDKLDRLVELLLHYDERSRRAEFKYYSSLENDDEEDPLEALSVKLQNGGVLFHRLGAIGAFVCVHSRKCHAHLMEQLTLQLSGIGLVKTAVHEFVQVLEEDTQQKRLMESYLQQI